MILSSICLMWYILSYMASNARGDDSAVLSTVQKCDVSKDLTSTIEVNPPPSM
jgi:hypothetical protein